MDFIEDCGAKISTVEHKNSFVHSRSRSSFDL